MEKESEDEKQKKKTCMIQEIIGNFAKEKETYFKEEKKIALDEKNKKKVAL